VFVESSSLDENNNVYNYVVIEKIDEEISRDSTSLISVDKRYYFNNALPQKKRANDQSDVTRRLAIGSGNMVRAHCAFKN
jgi:hypothetical protein